MLLSRLASELLGVRVPGARTPRLSSPDSVVGPLRRSGVDTTRPSETSVGAVRPLSFESCGAVEPLRSSGSIDSLRFAVVDRVRFASIDAVPPLPFGSFGAIEPLASSGGIEPLRFAVVERVRFALTGVIDPLPFAAAGDMPALVAAVIDPLPLAGARGSAPTSRPRAVLLGSNGGGVSSMFSTRSKFAVSISSFTPGVRGVTADRPCAVVRFVGVGVASTRADIARPASICSGVATSVGWSSLSSRAPSSELVGGSHLPSSEVIARPPS
jgi:hypothetical protein